MGIGSRSYARPYSMGGGLPYGIKWLLIANVVVFLLQLFGLGGLLTEYFALQPFAVFSSFAVWQLVTYMFLHGGIFHILFNMLALWMFGSELEGTWGTRAFLKFYFFCGIGAGVCIVLAHYWFGNPASVTLGASGAIYGVLLASAVMWPDRIIYFWGIFPLAMKYMVMIYGAIAFLGSANLTSGVSNIGHLGGLLSGWIYLKTPALSRSRSRGPSVSPLAAIQQRYKLWKLERNKRKFQVYMKKHGSNRDIN